MSWMSGHAESLETPDLVLHLGAGHGEELAVYQAFPDASVCLVEPQPGLARKLREKVATSPNMRVCERVIGDRKGRSTFFELSHPLLSSSHKPDQLDRFYPGITIVNRRETPVVTIPGLIADLGVPVNPQSWLVLDIPGFAAGLLETLLGQDLAVSFGTVFIRQSNEPLYEGAATTETVGSLMRDMGYLQVGTADQSDPDWTWRHYRHFPAFLASRRQCEALETRVSALTMAALETTTQGSDFTADSHAGTVTELRGQLAEKAVEIERLEALLNTARAELAEANTVQRLRVQDLDELRVRFQAVNEHNGRQQLLLEKLGRRLGEISCLLAEIDETRDTADAQRTAERLVTALIGDAGSDG